MGQAILTINAGSSTLKFALFDTTNDLVPMARGMIEKIDGSPRLVAKDAKGIILADQHWPAGEAIAFPVLLDAVLQFCDAHLEGNSLVAVGHRVVHGGAAYLGPEIVTPALLNALEVLTPLDPLHMPNNLAPMHALLKMRPHLTQVACFDTAFHHTIPPVAARYALTRTLEMAGVRRYGFHGLSYEYIATNLARQAPLLAKGRVIIAHLGSGASLCALQGGQSIATTMGFSTLDGLVMATRCGSLDPGVILYLCRQSYSFEAIEDMLYRHSGLLGVSGISGDVRVLLASDAPEARDAIELFTYRIACEVGSMVSALGGLDGLVFTAGIGEHSAQIRTEICHRLAWLGLRLDPLANSLGAVQINAPDSCVDVRIIPTNEEAMIARHTQKMVNQGRTYH